MVNKAVAHFKKNDPRIALLLETIELEEITPRLPKDFFRSLCSDIIGQQLSGKVADVIEGRFKKAVKSVTPRNVLGLSDDALRKTGMSWSKVKFIKDLAGKVMRKEVNLSDLVGLDDAEVVAELTKIKGIGPWTAEMFLIFTLGRPDVFSYGDLGLKRAIQKLYAFRKDPTVKQMQKIVKHWSPYRSYAARVLWRYLDNR